VIGHNALVTKEKPNLRCNENFPDRKNVEENCELLKLVIKKHSSLMFAFPKIIYQTSWLMLSTGQDIMKVWER